MKVQHSKCIYKNVPVPIMFYSHEMLDADNLRQAQFVLYSVQKMMLAKAYKIVHL